MKEHTAPGGVTVEPDDNVLERLRSRVEEAPDHPALAHRDGDRFVTVTTTELWQTVRELAAGLVAAGIGKGDRVALHCGTRIEFTYFDYAIMAAGAAVVTIYETSSAEQVEWILSDSGAIALITENEQTFAVYDQVKSKLPDCSTVFVVDDGAVETIAAMATEESRDRVEERIAGISHDGLLTLVYTSGTTGNPKGCVLTHHNVIWTMANSEQSSVAVLMEPGNRTLMFLPLAHIFARTLQMLCVSSGVTVYYSSGIPNLAEEFPMVKPTWVFSVPRVFEKIYNGARARADADGKGAIFDRAAATAIAYSEAIDRGRVTIGTKLAHSLFDKLVYSKLRAGLGGNIAYAISGGAPLGARLGHFYRGIGLIVLEGYGLTETTAVATVNRPEAIRVGSVGIPVPGASVRIADDGEILLKGGMVFAGYWNNEQATAEVFEDRWFRTGDIGDLDDEGFLSITGRKKEIIITSAGKNVAPAVLEDRMRRHPLVSQVLVVGDARPFIAALVTLDEEALAQWTAVKDKAGLSREELRVDDDLHSEIQEAVDDANMAVSHAEAIKVFRILPEDLSIEGGELTPTLKVKRSVVMDKYAPVIESIYGT